MKINLNDNVRIQVLPKGIEIINRNRAEIQKFAPDLDFSTWNKPDKDGYLVMQLWTVMELFGAHIKIGMSPINTEIEVLGK